MFDQGSGVLSFLIHDQERNMVDDGSRTLAWDGGGTFECHRVSLTRDPWLKRFSTLIKDFGTLKRV
jgi:hypothetical protein